MTLTLLNKSLNVNKFLYYNINERINTINIINYISLIGIKVHPLDQSLKMIKTFIFFDLETTGLIEKKLMPKIIELSLIAVSRNAICETMEPLPRVLHKLVLPIHPNTDISKLIHNLTGILCSMIFN